MLLVYERHATSPEPLGHRGHNRMHAPEGTARESTRRCSLRPSAVNHVTSRVAAHKRPGPVPPRALENDNSPVPPLLKDSDWHSRRRRGRQKSIYALARARIGPRTIVPRRRGRRSGPMHTEYSSSPSSKTAYCASKFTFSISKSLGLNMHCWLPRARTA